MLPVYPLLWHPVRTRIDSTRAPAGRLVGVEYTYDYQPSEVEFQDALGPNDIVWIPLFSGTIHHPAEDFSQRVPEFDQNVRAVSEIAPRVKGVLVGNANAEIRFNGISMADIHSRCLTFVEKAGGFVRCHGRPVIAPVFEILVYDCYRGNCSLQKLILELDALVLSYAGCSWLFVEQGDHPRIPEARPYPELQEYFKRIEAWSGVGKMEGLRAGSASVLQSMAFSAGFVGWF